MPLPYHVRLLYSHFDGQDSQAPIGSVLSRMPPLARLVWLLDSTSCDLPSATRLLACWSAPCQVMSSDGRGAMGTVATESCEGCAC